MMLYSNCGFIDVLLKHFKTMRKCLNRITRRRPTIIEVIHDRLN